MTTTSKQIAQPVGVSAPKAPATPVTEDLAALLARYGCGPIAFTGTSDALYDRHLLFDNVIDVKAAGAHEQFDAFAHAVRDVLSQRWIKTEQTYDKARAKRIYYLS